MKIVKDKTRIRGDKSQITGYYHWGQSLPNQASPSPGSTVTYRLTMDIAKEQLVVSQSNPGPPYKSGGPFKVKRWSFRRRAPRRAYSATYLQQNGYLARTSLDAYAWCSNVSGFSPDIISDTRINSSFAMISFPTEDLEVIANRAWNNFSPLKGKGSLGQSIIELKREGMPKVPLKGYLQDIRKLLSGIPKGRTPKLRRVLKTGGGWSSEYLNLVFGWRPLLKDVLDISQAFSELDSKVKQILRDNNRGVRREGTVYRKVISHTETPLQSTIPFSPGFERDGDIPLSDTNGRGKVVEHVEEHVWFSARYRYYLPLVAAEDNDWWVGITKARLLGLDPSPHLLWKVTPWSWLIDWFVNVGDVIDRLDGDGIGRLTADYAYIMRHRKASKTVTLWQIATKATTRVIPTPQYTYFRPALQFEEEVSETKERMAASQFGFGFTYPDLTNGQKWILAALGQNLINSKL